MQRHDLWQQGEDAHRARVEAAQQGAGSAHWLGHSGPPQAGVAPFLSTVDHELRRPLSLIFGYAELLQQRTERWADAGVAELASEILTNSRMMIRLLDDLTHFTQTGSDHLRIQPRWVEVGELLRQLVHSGRSRPGGHWIQVEQAGPLRAYLDPERLLQVVENLLSNARRYAPDRPVTIRATGGSGGLRIEVVDEGPGISPEEQRRIWERGYRGATAVKTDAHGSGLGLPLVKQLVELQGGTVGVRSRPGAGTTFWFTLPAGLDQPARRSSSAAGASLGPGPEHATRP